jgi:hypothetical protein
LSDQDMLMHVVAKLATKGQSHARAAGRGGVEPAHPIAQAYSQNPVTWRSAMIAFLRGAKGVVESAEAGTVGKDKESEITYHATFLRSPSTSAHMTG